MTTLGSTQIYMFSAFKRAYERMVSFAQQARPGFVCFCVGPGGAGKTRLSQMIGPDAFGSTEVWQKDAKPYLWVTADNSDKAYFNQKSFTRRCLIELGDPFVSSQFVLPQSGLDAAATRALILHSSITSRLRSEMDMRDAFVRIARLRQVKLLIVDEANLLVMTHATRRPTDYLESLRVMADQIGCSLLLLGTLDLLRLMNHSAQLNRRSLFVHLERMNCSDSKTKAEFVEFLKNVEADNGLTPGLLSGRPNEIYKWTYGIPGEIDGLVTRARIHAGGELEGLEWNHVLEARPLKRVIERMRAEADLIETSFEYEPRTKDPAPLASASSSTGRKRRAAPQRRVVGPVQ